MRIKNRDGRRFLHEIKGAIPCTGKMKKNLLKEMGDNICSYIAEYPEADYQSMIKRFGEPREIVSSYIHEMDAKEISRRLRIGRKCGFAALTAICLIVLLWVGAVYSAMSNHISNEAGYIVEEFVDVYSGSGEKGE